MIYDIILISNGEFPESSAVRTPCFYFQGPRMHLTHTLGALGGPPYPSTLTFYYFYVDPMVSPSGPPTSSFTTTPGTHGPSGHTCRHALNPTGTLRGIEVKTLESGTSLAVQLRICLAMKGTQDQSLLWEVRSCMQQSVPERGREDKGRKKCLQSG